MSTKLNKHAFLFYVLVGTELCFFPILYVWEEVKKRFSFRGKFQKRKQRPPVKSNIIHVGIHEWGGYHLQRKKTIKNGPTFECGLMYQLSRFKSPVRDYKTKISVSISDKHIYPHSRYVEANADLVTAVSNAGMDFSGYAYHFERIKNLPDGYVILTNSSVDKHQEPFLEEYITYMEHNPDVGILGISYSTKIYQTFIRNNFNPHIQSFFYLTTIGVLSEIVKSNGGKFPGANIKHKLLLIRNGEVRVSQLALQLGYNLAFVQENGGVYKFGIKGWMDNGYNNWKLPLGDVRQISQHPNRINKLSEQ